MSAMTMTTANNDFAAKAAAIDTQWRDHLAAWARRELKRRGLHMDPDGKIRPLPFKQPFRRPPANGGGQPDGALR
jgi:hypothetical protein